MTEIEENETGRERGRLSPFSYLDTDIDRQSERERERKRRQADR